MKKLGLGVLIVLASALWFGCGSGGETETPGDDCVAGKGCVCSGTTCDLTCGGDGANCGFTCPKGATCKFSCPGGNCQTTCTDSASCVTDCPGGSCALACTGTADCQITACKNACALSCNGAATCQNSCDVTAGCGTKP